MLSQQPPCIWLTIVGTEIEVTEKSEKEETKERLQEGQDIVCTQLQKNTKMDFTAQKEPSAKV